MMHYCDLLCIIKLAVAAVFYQVTVCVFGFSPGSAVWSWQGKKMKESYILTRWFDASQLYFW